MGESSGMSVNEAVILENATISYMWLTCCILREKCRNRISFYPVYLILNINKRQCYINPTAAPQGKRYCGQVFMNGVQAV